METIRTITIQIDELGRPMTENKLRRSNRYKVGEWVRSWRTVAKNRWARETRMQKLSHCYFDCVYARITPHYPSRQYLPDTDAVAPTLKAVLDGAVDAGLLLDDTSTYVRQIIYDAPIITDTAAGVRVSITGIPKVRT